MLYDQVNPSTEASTLGRIKAFKFFLSIRFRYYMIVTTPFHFLIKRKKVTLTIMLRKIHEKSQK